MFSHTRTIHKIKTQSNTKYFRLFCLKIVKFYIYFCVLSNLKYEINHIYAIKLLPLENLQTKKMTESSVWHSLLKTKCAPATVLTAINNERLPPRIKRSRHAQEALQCACPTNQLCLILYPTRSGMESIENIFSLLFSLFKKWRQVLYL